MTTVKKRYFNIEPGQARASIAEDLSQLRRVCPSDEALIKEWIDGLSDQECIRVLQYYTTNRVVLPPRHSGWQAPFAAWRVFRMTLEDEMARELPAKPNERGGDIGSFVSDEEINRIMKG